MRQVYSLNPGQIVWRPHDRLPKFWVIARDISVAERFGTYSKLGTDHLRFTISRCKCTISRGLTHYQSRTIACETVTHFILYLPIADRAMDQICDCTTTCTTGVKPVWIRNTSYTIKKERGLTLT
jgi:hypothetical protein